MRKPGCGSAEGSNLISAVSKTASVSVTVWDMINLEPECTLFNAANTQNVSRDAHTAST